MDKQIAWNTFKNTGSIDAFLEYKQIQNLEEKEIKVDYLDGDNKDKGNNNFGK